MVGAPVPMLASNLPTPLENGVLMIALIVLGTLVTAGAVNAVAQRFSTHPGVEAWPSDR